MILWDLDELNLVRIRGNSLYQTGITGRNGLSLRLRYRNDFRVSVNDLLAQISRRRNLELHLL